MLAPRRHCYIATMYIATITFATLLHAGPPQSLLRLHCAFNHDSRWAPLCPSIDELEHFPFGSMCASCHVGKVHLGIKLLVKYYHFLQLSMSSTVHSISFGDHLWRTLRKKGDGMTPWTFIKGNQCQQPTNPMAYGKTRAQNTPSWNMEHFWCLVWPTAFWFCSVVVCLVTNTWVTQDEYKRNPSRSQVGLDSIAVSLFTNNRE